MSAGEAVDPPRERWFLKLYPREWRERYGAELAELVGDKPLSIANAFDLIAGAIDARVSKEKKMPAALKACLTRNEPQGIADGLRGAGMMIGGSLLFVSLGVVARRQGWPDLAEALTTTAFPVSLALMSHVMYLRKASAIARWTITGGTLTILTIITLIDTL